MEVNLFVKRKLILTILTTLMITLLLSSCSLGGSMLSKIFGSKEGQFFEGTDSLGNPILGRYSHDDQGDANAKMDKVLEAIKNKDKGSLKKMFSIKAISEAKDFDQSIIDLFDYFLGDFISYNDWGGPGVHEGINDDGTSRNWKSIDSSYDVKTSKQIYRFAIQEYTQDTANSDNVGIQSLYIIKMEDDTDPQFGYRGDNKNTPGISINIKNALPEDDPSIGN